MREYTEWSAKIPLHFLDLIYYVRNLIFETSYIEKVNIHIYEYKEDVRRVHEIFLEIRLLNLRMLSVKSLANIDKFLRSTTSTYEFHIIGILLFGAWQSILTRRKSKVGNAQQVVQIELQPFGIISGRTSRSKSNRFEQCIHSAIRDD